jgi:GDPmannose 4,6-dehydratase
MLQQEEPDDYVVATGETYTVRDFLVAAFKEIGIDDFKPFVVQDPRFMRPSEVPYLRGEPSKAREKLGWSHKISFEDLVRTMVNYDIERLE